jgi:hypothetical protein
VIQSIGIENYHSEERYSQTEEQLLADTETYESYPNGQVGQTLLTTAEVLARVQQKAHRTRHDEVNERHQYPDIFFSERVNSIFALFRLVKQGDRPVRATGTSSPAAVS